MSPEAQRIAIAEACGWEYVITEPHFNKLYQPGANRPVGMCCGKHVSKEDAFRVCFNRHPEIAWVVPDYLNDLNAMHEAEKVLGGHDRFNYSAELERVVFLALGDTKSAWCYSSATAAARAEAFLKTIGKWTD